jgi:hypothetical protein
VEAKGELGPWRDGLGPLKGIDRLSEFHQLAAARQAGPDVGLDGSLLLRRDPGVKVSLQPVVYVGTIHSVQPS